MFSSMGMLIFLLLVAFAGGAVGAYIGGNYAFALTGFCVLASWGIYVASGSTMGFDYLAFGPFMGPHVAFAGGVAGAIYAAYKGHMADGKDVNSALAGLGKVDIYVVGGIFGVFGLLCQSLLATYVFNSNTTGIPTDTVALTVLLSGLLARIVFGGTPGKGLFKGSLVTAKGFDPKAKTLVQKFKPSDYGRWLVWQEKASQYVSIGIIFSLFAGGSSLFLAAQLSPKLGDNVAGVANTFAFGISAVIILFLISGREMPVQHHVTNIAGLAAVQFFPILMGPDYHWAPFTAETPSSVWLMAAVALLIAVFFGVFTSALCEYAARLWYNRGTSHIDPPAAAIWVGNTVVLLLAGLLG